METEQVTALVIVEQLTPMQLFSQGALRPILDKIKAEVRAIETDISTESGRKAVASLAYKVARTKTFIDDQRVKLVADEKKRLAAIDAEGKKVREELDELKEEVRKPLTDWEDAEKNRVAEHERRISDMKAVSDISHFSLENVATARAYLDERWDHNFQEFSKRAIQAREAAELHLAREEAAIRKAEQERVEAERIRLEAEKRARVEREAKIAEEARLKAEAEAKRRMEAQAREAKQREEELARRAAEEKARLERESKEAEERYEREKIAAEARIQKAIDDDKAARRREKIAAEERARKAESDRVAAAKKAEADRVAAVEAERRRNESMRRAEEEKRAAIAREKARREANEKHRSEVHDEIVLALLGEILGLNNESAREIVLAVSQGLIPNVSIIY